MLSAHKEVVIADEYRLVLDTKQQLQFGDYISNWSHPRPATKDLMYAAKPTSIGASTRCLHLVVSIFAVLNQVPTRNREIGKGQIPPSFIHFREATSCSVTNHFRPSWLSFPDHHRIRVALSFLNGKRNVRPTKDHIPPP
jgi:hypothetical protein